MYYVCKITSSIIKHEQQKDFYQHQNMLCCSSSSKNLNKLNLIIRVYCKNLDWNIFENQMFHDYDSQNFHQNQMTRQSLFIEIRLELILTERIACINFQELGVF